MVKRLIGHVFGVRGHNGVTHYRKFIFVEYLVVS
jgi:hypothetical protein